MAGSLMLTAGLGIWAVTALSHAIPHSLHTLAWLAAVALLTAGACCGVLMIVVLLGAGGRFSEPANPAWPQTRLPGPPPAGPRPAAGPPAVPRPGRGAPPAVPPPGRGAPSDPGAPDGPGLPMAAWPEPEPWPAGAGLPLDTGPRPRAELAHDETSGPEAGEWTGTDRISPQADPDAGEWARVDGGYAAQADPGESEWAGPEEGFGPQAGQDAGDWGHAADEYAPGDGLAADDWAGPDEESGAEPRPGAVLGQGEWTVREPESRPGPDDWPSADHGQAAAGEPVLDLWPGHGAEWAGAGPAGAEPAPGYPAGDLDDGPAHRVESAFNVWQRPGPDAADPGAADQDEPASPGTAADEWGPPQAAGRRPGDDLLPAAGYLPAAPRRPADDEDDQPVVRRQAQRRSGPAPGWNPDSEEDWLRVLRGLRSSEDS